MYIYLFGRWFNLHWMLWWISDHMQIPLEVDWQKLTRRGLQVKHFWTRELCWETLKRCSVIPFPASGHNGRINPINVLSRFGSLYFSWRALPITSYRFKQAFRPSKWDKFPDSKMDNIELGGYTPVNKIMRSNVLFIASFHDNARLPALFFCVFFVFSGGYCLFLSLSFLKLIGDMLHSFLF